MLAAEPDGHSSDQIRTLPSLGGSRSGAEPEAAQESNYAEGRVETLSFNGAEGWELNQVRHPFVMFLLPLPRDQARSQRRHLRS